MEEILCLLMGTVVVWGPLLALIIHDRSNSKLRKFMKDEAREELAVRANSLLGRSPAEIMNEAQRLRLGSVQYHLKGSEDLLWVAPAALLKHPQYVQKLNQEYGIAQPEVTEEQLAWQIFERTNPIGMSGGNRSEFISADGHLVLTTQALIYTSGPVTWTVPLENIAFVKGDLMWMEIRPANGEAYYLATDPFEIPVIQLPCVGALIIEQARSAL